MKSEKKVLIIFVSFMIIFSVAAAVFITNNYEGPKDNPDIEPNDEILRQQVKKDLAKFRMYKRLRQRSLTLNKTDFVQISDFQKYVTPNDLIVTSYLENNDIVSMFEAYNEAVKWIWVSDSVLHNTLEEWLLPRDFISQTPLDPDNPVPGSMVSDCESQAYTLVSMIEALGYPKEDIRVVIGLVDFGGEIGGHAWVQLYQDGKWFELEVTTGSYWDEEENKIELSDGIDFDYFKTKPYPVEEYWAFFNDIYFYNPNTGKKSLNLPNYWLV